jgi:hypothetical protein
MGKRGFGGMSPEKRKRISSMGGLAAQAMGRGHQFTSEDAKLAGAKGGKAVAAKHGLEYMRELGRKGGLS